MYLVAEDMFRRMARGERAITKSEVDSAVTNLLLGRSEDSPELVKSARDLRMAVKRMVSSALESTPNSEEVYTDLLQTIYGLLLLL